MTDTILIRLLGDSRADLEAGVRRLRAAGLDIEWRPFDELEDGQVDGTLRLYDTPETVAEKARAARSIIDQAIETFRDP